MPARKKKVATSDMARGASGSCASTTERTAERHGAAPRAPRTRIDLGCFTSRTPPKWPQGESPKRALALGDVGLELGPELRDERVHRQRRGVAQRADGVAQADRRERGDGDGDVEQQLEVARPRRGPPRSCAGCAPARACPRGRGCTGRRTPRRRSGRRASSARTMQVVSSITMTPPEPAMVPLAFRASNSSATSISSADEHRRTTSRRG